MSEARKPDPIELYQEIEGLYLKENFHSILKFSPVFKEIDSIGFDSDMLKCLYEIFARTYLELDNLVKAKEFIDQRLAYLSDKDMSHTVYSEDLLIFTLLKLEVLQKQELIKEEYQSILIYEKRGESDNKILNRKFEIEESFYRQYVKVNKYLLYVILLAVLLANLDLLPNSENYIPALTVVALTWYVLNIVMNCRVKRLYLRLVRFIYS